MSVLRKNHKIVLWCAAFATMGSWAVSAAMPKTYIATARLREDTTDVIDQAWALEQTNPMAYGGCFISTPFERIQSKLILYRVIDRLNLCEKWGYNGEKQTPLAKAEAYVKLKRSLDLREAAGPSQLSKNSGQQE